MLELVLGGIHQLEVAIEGLQGGRIHVAAGHGVVGHELVGVADGHALAGGMSSLANSSSSPVSPRGARRMRLTVLAWGEALPGGTTTISSLSAGSLSGPMARGSQGTGSPQGA